MPRARENILKKAICMWGKNENTLGRAIIPWRIFTST